MITACLILVVLIDPVKSALVGQSTPLRLNAIPTCGTCRLKLEHIADLSSEGNLTVESRVARLATGGYVVAPTGDPAGIAVYASDGKYVSTVGRRGSGPGEFRRIGGVFAARNGDIYVMDEGARQVVILDQTLRYRTAARTQGVPKHVLFGGGDTVLVQVEGPYLIERLVNHIHAGLLVPNPVGDIGSSFTKVRRLGDGALWGVRFDRYELLEFDGDSKVARRHVADVSWFLPFEQRRRDTGSGMAGVIDLGAVDPNTLGVVIQRYKAHFRPIPDGAPLPAIGPGEILRDSEFILEIVDRNEVVRVASLQAEGLVIGGFVEEGSIYSYREDTDGAIALQLWRVRVSRD